MFGQKELESNYWKTGTKTQLVFLKGYYGVLMFNNEKSTLNSQFQSNINNLKEV